MKGFSYCLKSLPGEVKKDGISETLAVLGI
jgi:hypothetical protein